MAKKNQIIPCPFCGGTAVYDDMKDVNGFGGNGKGLGGCFNSECRFQPFGTFKDFDEFLWLWNLRFDVEKKHNIDKYVPELNRTKYVMNYKEFKRFTDAKGIKHGRIADHIGMQRGTFYTYSKTERSFKEFDARRIAEFVGVDFDKVFTERPW